MIPDSSPLGMPVAVKPAASGSSIGLSLVFEEKDFQAACKEAFRHSSKILIERYIDGRELTIGILGGEALPVVEEIPQRRFYDYEAKYGNSGTRYECTAKIGDQQAAEAQATALKVFQVLGCRAMTRVDILLDRKTGELFVLEANSIPGLTGKSLLPKAAKAKGIEFPELCVKIMELSWSHCETGQKSFEEKKSTQQLGA